MADLALLVLTLFWGTTFSLVKEALEGASVGVFLSLRFAVALVMVASVWAVRGDRAGRRLLRHGALLGLAMLAGFWLQTLGLRHTTPARSGFITGLSVVIVPFIARFFLGRPVRIASWLGVALAVVGLLVLTRPLGEAVTAEIRLGDLLTFGCALAFALQIVFTAEWSPRHPLAPFVAVQLGVTLLGALASIAIEGPRLAPEAPARFAATVAFTGVVMTALAFFVMNWAQRHTSAVRAALIFSLEPVTAALFSVWYWGEPLGPWELAGGGLIVLGVVLGEVGGALEARAVPAPPA
ncbi:MAG TPA: DMT family transporter [Anaeromyxobacteraceae bacterium]|nr:DMT family transporter [Anaeromyxobacteraceae bacterium]